MSANDDDKTSFKCRRCRQFLFSNSSVLPSVHCDEDSTNSLTSNHGNMVATFSPRQCSVGNALWYISDEATPPWVQSVIEESQWTRGKLACPKCGGRLGSFDFLTPSIRHHHDRQQKQWSCIQIIGSRVDRETPDLVLTKLRRGNPTRLHLACPSSSLTQFGPVDTNTGSHSEEWWYLNTNEVDTNRLFENCDLTGFDSESEPTGKHSVKKDEPGNLLVPLTSEISHNVDTSDSSEGCNVEEKTACQVLPHEANSFQNMLLKDNHTKQPDIIPSSADSENASLETDSVDEAIQFGFSTNAYGKIHCKSQTIHGCKIKTTTSENATSNPQMQAQKVLSLPIPSNSLNLSKEHQFGQKQNTQDNPSDYRISNVDGILDGLEADRPAKSDSSARKWQDFLDELLSELEAEKSGMLPTASRQCRVSQLADERENVNSQIAFEDTEVGVSQSENPDDSQSMPASLERAILRVQKRERNRRKSERRKLRRRERWMEQKEMENRELLVEEQNLDAGPRDILNLLDSHDQTNASIREALTCPVCLDLFLNPHTCRPCEHIFCESCLRHLARATQVSGGTTPCPLCRTVIVNAQPNERLTTTIQELFPRLVAQRKQAEHKILKSAHALPGQNTTTSLASWVNRTLIGHNRRTRFHHWQLRGGRQERMMVGMITGAARQFGAVVVVMSMLVGISGIFFFAMLNYS